MPVFLWSKGKLKGKMERVYFIKHIIATNYTRILHQKGGSRDGASSRLSIFGALLVTASYGRMNFMDCSVIDVVFGGHVIIDGLQLLQRERLQGMFDGTEQFLPSCLII